MTRDTIDKNLETAFENEMKLLIKSQAEVQKEVQKKPTSENLKKMRGINKLLFEAKKARGNSGTGSDISFKNIAEVTAYLVGNNFKVSRSTVDNHVEKKMLVADKDGTFPYKDVMKYASVHLTKIGGTKDDEDPETSNHLRDKAAAASRKELAQAIFWENKNNVNDGTYVEAALWEQNLAGRAQIFKSDLQNVARSDAAKIIETVKGDPLLEPELVKFLLKRFNKVIGRYSKDKEFIVPNGISAGNNTA